MQTNETRDTRQDPHSWGNLAIADESLGVLQTPKAKLAEYFASFGKEEPGATRLSAWFHENKSPMNAVIREALAKQMDQILGDHAGKTSKILLGELHNKKSKELHHTYNGMWGVHCTKIDNGKLVHTGFDYGACSFPRALLDITRFFESSI